MSVSMKTRRLVLYLGHDHLMAQLVTTRIKPDIPSALRLVAKYWDMDDQVYIGVQESWTGPLSLPLY